MTFTDDKDDERRPKAGRPRDPAADEKPAVRARKRTNRTEFGPALRNAYQRTVEEAIPPEMLDLLGKLG